jgi:hypothetical protein
MGTGRLDSAAQMQSMRSKKKGHGRGSMDSGGTGRLLGMTSLSSKRGPGSGSGSFMKSGGVSLGGAIASMNGMQGLASARPMGHVSSGARPLSTGTVSRKPTSGGPGGA